jgi:peptidoglycan/LPS O-acetylase OafA/YrhL
MVGASAVNSKMPYTKAFFFDVMRGLSAQMVLVGHALNVCFPSYFMQAGRGDILEARPGLLYIQNLGVLVFFCISGYLVTSSILRRSNRDGYALTDYMLDRFARIFTPLLPLLLLLFVIDNVLAWQGWQLRYTELNSDPLTLLLNSLMLFGHVGMSVLARLIGVAEFKAGAFGTADQLWTVVIEWWIYVGFGIIAFAVMNRKRPSVARTALLLFALLPPFYLLARGNGLVVAWIIGMLGAIGQPRLALLPKIALALTCVTMISAAAICALWNSLNFYHPFFAAAFSLALLTAHQLTMQARRTRNRGFVTQFLSGLSTISYFVYLVHLSVLFWVVAWTPDYSESIPMVIALVLAANMVSICFYFCFERHYPKIRSWLDVAMKRQSLMGGHT